MPAISTRQTLLELLRERLGTIRIADGFLTDAGQTVYLGEAPPLGSNDPDTALVIVPGDDTGLKQQGKKILRAFPVEIQILAKADLDEPWVAVEQMLTDVKRAIEQDDELLRGGERSLSAGPTCSLAREPGSLTTGAGITYQLTYGETWGAP